MYQKKVNRDQATYLWHC